MSEDLFGCIRYCTMPGGVLLTHSAIQIAIQHQTQMGAIFVFLSCIFKFNLIVSWVVFSLKHFQILTYD